MTSGTRRVAVLLVALFAVTAGCTGAGGGDGGNAELAGETGFQGDSGAVATGTPMAEPVDESAAADIGGYDAQQFANRQLILTGQVAVEVNDFDSARANLTRATETYGGFVSDRRQEVHRVDNQTWTEGIVVLRVPRENFTALLETAEAEGELLQSEQNRQDVTDQLVDLRARLDNLRAERDQLRELYERANDTEDVLRVQERLSDVQGEIERLEARQQSLQERVALSTITVRIAEERPEPDRVVPDRWYDVPLVAAFLASVDGVVVTIRAIAVAGAYAAPYLLVFGVPLAAAGYVVRQRRGPRPPGRIRRWLRRRRGGADPEGEPDRPENGSADQVEEEPADYTKAP